VDPALSYDFGEIEYSVRQEIHTTSARFNAALDELRAQIAPLQQLWTREAAAAYQVEQLRWHQAATALNEILVDLGNACATARRRWQTPTAGPPASGDGSRVRQRPVGPGGGESSGPHSHFDLRGWPSVCCSVGVRYAGASGQCRSPRPTPPFDA
jgi:ESAT-6 family protein